MPCVLGPRPSPWQVAGMSNGPSSSTGRDGSSDVSSFDMDALEGHLAFAMMVANSSNFKSTWELVETPKDLANYKVVQPSGPLPTVRGFDALPDPVSKRVLQESQSSALTGMLGKRVKVGVSWESRLEARTLAAFKKWSAIIMFSPLSFDLGRRHTQDRPLGDTLLQGLAHVFVGSRSTRHSARTSIPATIGIAFTGHSTQPS